MLAVALVRAPEAPDNETRLALTDCHVLRPAATSSRDQGGPERCIGSP